MSYSDDCMRGLSASLREHSATLKEIKELVLQLKSFNENQETLKRIAIALEKQNKLKEIELGISKTRYL